MLKLADLRAHLTAAVPELARDPERLIVMAGAGRIIKTGTLALSFEYAYTARLFVLDYAGHADAIIVPLLAWLNRNQPEAFDNPDLREKALRFEAEHLTTSTIDLSIEIDLTERVLVRSEPNGPPGQLVAIHVPEPPPIGVVTKPEHWRLYVQGEQAAEWRFDPHYPPPRGTP